MYGVQEVETTPKPHQPNFVQVAPENVIDCKKSMTSIQEKVHRWGVILRNPPPNTPLPMYFFKYVFV